MALWMARTDAVAREVLETRTPQCRDTSRFDEGIAAAISQGNARRLGAGGSLEGVRFVPGAYLETPPKGKSRVAFDL